MHNIEPYFNWLHLYVAEEDERSPFFGVERNELEFSQTVYNYFIHPYWDFFGSSTLYLKILFMDYDQGYVIMELIGEWNDAIENDIMTLKREVIEPLMKEGISKFILIPENVLNFHSGDADYYEEWYEDVSEKDGWIVCLNMPEQNMEDFRSIKLQYFIELMELPDWRIFQPQHLFSMIDTKLSMRLE